MRHLAQFFVLLMKAKSVEEGKVIDELVANVADLRQEVHALRKQVKSGAVNVAATLVRRRARARERWCCAIGFTCVCSSNPLGTNPKGERVQHVVLAAVVRQPVREISIRVESCVAPCDDGARRSRGVQASGKLGSCYRVKRRAWHSQADTRKKELATRAISAATREPVQTALKSVSGERMLVVHIKAVKKVRKERYDRVELIKRRSAAVRGRAAPGRDDDDDVDRPADVARADDDFPEVCACACVC
jgi:hypothetical protein